MLWLQPITLLMSSASSQAAQGDENPADLESVGVIEADQHENEELLGRLHNQKIFYRPVSRTYVDG